MKNGNSGGCDILFGLIGAGIIGVAHVAYGVALLTSAEIGLAAYAAAKLGELGINWVKNRPKAAKSEPESTLSPIEQAENSVITLIYELEKTVARANGDTQDKISSICDKAGALVRYLRGQDECQRRIPLEKMQTRLMETLNISKPYLKLLKSAPKSPEMTRVAAELGEALDEMYGFLSDLLNGEIKQNASELSSDIHFASEKVKILRKGQ